MMSRSQRGKSHLDEILESEENRNSQPSQFSCQQLADSNDNTVVHRRAPRQSILPVFDDLQSPPPMSPLSTATSTSSSPQRLAIVRPQPPSYAAYAAIGGQQRSTPNAGESQSGLYEEVADYHTSLSSRPGHSVTLPPPPYPGQHHSGTTTGVVSRSSPYYSKDQSYISRRMIANNGGGDERRIQIKKNERETLGISVDVGRHGGVYITAASETSLAARSGLQVGDQLLDVSL